MFDPLSFLSNQLSCQVELDGYGVLRVNYGMHPSEQEKDLAKRVLHEYGKLVKFQILNEKASVETLQRYGKVRIVNGQVIAIMRYCLEGPAC